MSFVIDNVPLIPQDQNMACWYASVQMLIRWRRDQTQSSEIAHPDPSQVPELESVHQANTGLPFSQTIELAKSLGLEAVNPMTPTPGALENWLRRCGPLWFAGRYPGGHAVVVTGIDETNIYINDPWPPNQGKIYTVTYQRFGEVLKPLVARPSTTLESIEDFFEPGPFELGQIPATAKS